MKRLLALAFAGAAILPAQQDPEGALFEKVYAKLAASFSAGGAQGKGGVFLLMAHPGISLTPEFLAGEHDVSELADQIPLSARYYQLSGKKYSFVYNTILNEVEASNFVNQANRQLALQARRTIYDRTRPNQPTPAFADYLKYRAAYRTANDALTSAQTDNLTLGTALPPGLQKAAEDALKAWEAKGNRKLIEDAQKSLTTFYNENVKALFGRLAEEFTGSERNDQATDPWHLVTATPPPGEWLAEADWHPFKLTPAEKNLATATALPLEARPGKAAAQSLPAGFIASVSLELETKRVSFARTWMDEGVFSSHGWRFQPKCGFTLVSSGNPADPDPGPMPFLVTGVLLSRKLMLKGAYSGALPKELTTLGPFSLKGAAPPKAAGQVAITVPGAQIIGFFCEPIPKSPTPDAKAFRTP